MKPEVYYVWKEYDNGRYVTPRTDSMQHEHPFDYISSSAEDAYKVLKDFDGEEEAKQEEWVLCKVAIVPIEKFNRIILGG